MQQAKTRSASWPIRAAALLELRRRGVGLEERSGARADARRDPAERRRYAGDPWAYIADILGLVLTPQQEAALELMEREDRVLLASANNVGKTFLLGAYGIYRMDAVAALPDEDNGLEEQGARVLLPGPDHPTIFATVFSEMLALAARAERRGHLMPGERSDRSVLWRVRAKWQVEAFSPPKNVAQQVAHTASGRHHRNQVALVEEGQGVAERLWKGAEGMCSSAGNKIVSSFNPTEPVGPAFQRARSGAYAVLHLSAFEHPNILRREPVIPDAVDVHVIDARVRTECRDRGPYPATRPEETHGDFLYALPSRGVEERGPRGDGILGHPDAGVRVYRPSPAFTAQVLGRWPQTSEHSLFDPAAWDRAVERWQASPDPDATPDRVGVDIARDGADDTVAAPAWGETAEALLRAYVAARDESPEAIERLREGRRARVGELRALAKGHGVQVAQQLVRIFGDVPYTVDLTGVGTSPLDHLRHVLGMDVEGVSFGDAAPDPIAEGFIPWCENLRTWLYVTTATLVNLGLADVPDDPLLREEVMAHELEYRYRTVEVWESRGGTRVRTKKRVPSVLLQEKDAVKKKIGRSPDRSDTLVLALYGVVRAAAPIVAPAGISRSSPWRMS